MIFVTLCSMGIQCKGKIIFISLRQNVMKTYVKQNENIIGFFIDSPCFNPLKYSSLVLSNKQNQEVLSSLSRLPAVYKSLNCLGDSAMTGLNPILNGTCFCRGPFRQIFEEPTEIESALWYNLAAISDFTSVTRGCTCFEDNV